MLRYKKHKKHAEGLAGSGVGVMDDTDREVSSFTDRAFRSLCVAEEELFNDVPHIPSPIRGMPLSTKYHLGIFNLSVRKTQPLAQLPSVSRQRGKWAPTFQPLLNSAKDGLIVTKTNTNKLCVPQPMGYKPCSSKVSSLIRSFDNIENERPEQDGMSFSKVVQKGKNSLEEKPLCDEIEHSDVNNEVLQSINTDETMLESHHLHRRTAREVFLESQAEISSRLSTSPCSSGSPSADHAKKSITHKESLRRTAFLHSENSAFKSWSDINKRHHGGNDSDSSIPGTPPILGSATPCSPLLQRTTPGRTKDAGLEVGWASPASTLSSSFDAIQMLRTVPPLPNKRTTKQGREPRAPKVILENKIQSADMQVDLGYQSPKEQLCILAKSKSPKKLKKASNTNQEKETVPEPSHNLPKPNEEVQTNVDSSKEVKKPETPDKNDDSKLPSKPTQPPGRIKTLIQQIEKESVKDVVPPNLPETKQNEASMETLPSTLHAKHIDSNPHSNGNVLVPPWRRMNAYKTELEDKLSNKRMNESSAEKVKENMAANEEDSFEEKPSTPSFNITNLLTPVIRRKSVQEALEEQPMVISPPLADTTTLNDQDQKEINMYRKRNEYKSKATGLLFNLKDMRKRVKSTYNPSTNIRNGFDNNHTTDGRLPEVPTYGTPLMDTSKQVSETENVSITDKENALRPAQKEENEHEGVRNSSDRPSYLCLSSPSHVMSQKGTENGDILTKEVHTEKNVPTETISSIHLSPTENLKNNVDYPLPNHYPKDDVIEKVQQKQDAPVEPVWRHKKKECPMQKETITPDSKQIEPSDTVSMPKRDFLGGIKNEASHTKESLTSPDVAIPCTAEGNESGNQTLENEGLKEDLEYYAVSNDNIESSKTQDEILKEETAEKAEEKEPLVTDKQVEENTNTEEIIRPSSIIQFKPNLFHIKDNTIKSSPVTKPVRPLLRSLSEDCLIFHKGEDYNLGKGDFRVTTPNSWKSRDAKIGMHKTSNSAAHNEEKHWNTVTTPQPALEVLNHNNKEDKHVPLHEVNEIGELWEKPCADTPDWRTNEEELTDIVNRNKGSKPDSPSYDGPFFHPVETCVSEVTGFSPECTTLLGHHSSNSMKDMVNGEDSSSPLLDNTNTNYSPLDSELLQFEDALCFSEDVVCSTITSPMSESITCSMLASPISITTQSSGFTTALSALDEMPSPPLPCVNPRNVKSNGSMHNGMSITPSPSGIMETRSGECMKQPQEKTQCVDLLNKAQAAKPPTVPPKTEKALRRAKRLTKKRRKTEIPPKIHEGDFQESDFVLDVPSPANIISPSVTPHTNPKPGSFMLRTIQQDESISETSTPSFPITQRKLLQDPESGQYFVVDIPVHFRIKTFFDPETGKYLQMSLPPSERSTPALDMASSPFIAYQGLAPVPVASIASLKGASQMLNHNGSYTGEKSGTWHEGEDDCLKMQQSIDCDSCDQSMAGTPLSMDRNACRTRSPDIISMGDIDDFAMEAIS